MADKSKKKTETEAPVSKSEAPKRKRQQTVRERTQQGEKVRGKRIRSTAGKIKGPVSKARSKGAKEFHLPLPDNKLGRIGRKRVKLVPGFIKSAWSELRQVTWPTAKETVRLTFAVFVFAVVFALIVGVLDFGLDKLFREVIIGR